MGNSINVAELPHMVTVACTFKPIMDILPRKATFGDLNVPLIANGGLMSQGALTQVPTVQNNPTENTVASPNVSNPF